MTIYISGKITGDPDYKEKFSEAAQAIRAMGYSVINPATEDEGLSYRAYIDMCVAKMQQADAIYLLPDWEDSKGAIFEKHYAEIRGMGVYDDPAPLYMPDDASLAELDEPARIRRGS